MSKVFICAVTPDEQTIKEEGVVAVATTIEAGGERRARAKLHWQFLEHHPTAQDCAYKFLVCEDRPGIPRPTLDSRGAEYTQESRWDKASASFVPVETESDPMNVTFDKLAPEVQNVVMVKFDTYENITVGMVISAQKLSQEDVATFDGHIIEALMKMPEVNAMCPEPELYATGRVKHKYIPGVKWPETQAEMRIWKKRYEGEHKGTGKYTSAVDPVRTRANQQYTENLTGKISPAIATIHREYKQTWKALSDEPAYVLWPGDVDAGNIDGNIHRWAKKEVIDNDREDWKCISASMRKQPDALRCDRQTIFDLVHERPIDIHKDPVTLNKYTCEYLTTKGVFGNEETDLGIADVLQSSETQTDAVETEVSDTLKNETTPEARPSVEREGPSYFLFADKDGEKYSRANKLPGLDKALAAGAIETTKEEYFARKNGTYTGLPQSVDTTEDSEQPEPIKVTANEVNKIIQATNISQPDADKLLAASCGEFIEGISDPDDPKWTKGAQTRDFVSQNQHESERNYQKAEQNSPNALQNESEIKQPEPVAHQEMEKACTAYGQTGGSNCPDCGAMMGDVIYRETFDEEYQAEVQEDDPEEMEGVKHPHRENTGGNQHHNSDNEAGGTADHPIKVNGCHEITSTNRTRDHLMVDLKIMGKNPDTPIISIGTMFSDPQTGDMGPEFSKTIDLETTGGIIDRDTIKRQLKQSREVQSATMTDETLLDDTLSQLRKFIDENPGESFVQAWGNGVNFDNTILRRSYERQGIPCPWRCYNDRDMRTIVELGRAMNFDARTAIPFEGGRHNALDDARYQAKYVSVTWQKLVPNQADF